jgi:uncharacterized protein involved in exopolysaccharide biosynthesis
MEELSTVIRESSPEEIGSGTTLRDIVLALFRQRRQFLVVGLLSFGLTCWWTFGTGKRYTSEMVLLVQNARGHDVITPGVSEASALNDVTEEQLNSEVAVLQSEDLLGNTVDNDWSSQHANRAPSDLQRHDQAVKSLRSRLDVSAIRSSHAIAVKLVSANPRDGKDTLDRLLAAFLQKQRDLGRPVGSTSFFEKQVAQSAIELHAARNELAAFQKTHGFVSLDTEETSQTQKLADLNAQLQQNEVQMSEARRQAEVEESNLRTTDKRISTVERTASASGAIDQLNASLVSLENKKTELLMIYKPTDRLVEQVDQQIADTQRGIKDAAKMNPNEMSTDVNPLWVAEQSDLVLSRTKLEALEAVHEKLRSQRQRLQGQLDSNVDLSPAFADLQRKVAELENNYQLVLQKRDASRMADMMDQQQWLNLAVIESPTLPLSPSHPKPSQDLFLGGITSILLGGVVVFLLESNRTTVATPAELETISRYPVLAVVPISLSRRIGNSTERTPLLQSD